MKHSGLLVGLLGLLFLLPQSVAANQSVCIQCHSGLDGVLGEPLQKWPGSVHAESGITCHNCHGGDPTDFALAMSPASGFLGVPAAEKIPEFCGRCHPGVLADYRQSAHGIALGAGGPQCVTCHGNHAVRKASLELINPDDCSRCHSYDRAEKILGVMQATDSSISNLQESLAGLHRLGFATRMLEGDLFAARNSFHRLFHTVDIAKVRLETTAIQAQLAKVREQIESRQAELSQRKRWGGFVVALLLLIGALALFLHHDFLGKKQEVTDSEGEG